MPFTPSLTKSRQWLAASLIALQVAVPFSTQAAEYVQAFSIRGLAVTHGGPAPVKNFDSSNSSSTSTSVGASVLKVAPSSINFGSVERGQQAAAQTIRLSNLGGGVAQLGTLSVGAPFTVTSNCDGVLLPALATCDVNVGFAPTVVAPSGIVGTLNVPVTSGQASGQASGSLQGVSESGSFQPDVGVSSQSVAFGQVAAPAVGSAALLVTNTGNQPLTAADISTTGAGFSATHNCPQTLSLGATCTVNVTFTPDSVSTYVGALNVKFSETPLVTATLTGAGTQNPVLTANSLSFVAAAVGATDSQNLTVTNTSAASMVIASKVLTGTNAADFSVTGCSAAIAPGGSCTFTVGFTSTSASPETATLTLSHAGSGGSSVISLSATTAAAPVDPYANSVSLLLHMDGANGGTSFVDSAGATVTPVNATTSTQHSKFGGSSALFPGSNSYLSLPYSTAYELTGNSWTVEGWVFLKNSPTPDKDGNPVATIASFGTASVNQGWSFNIYKPASGGSLSFGTNGSGANIMAANYTFALNTWYHVAAVRNNGVNALYVDGASVPLAANTYTGINAGSGGLTVGTQRRFSGYAYDFPGHLDEFRITKGAARYTGNFTPSAAAFAP